MTKGVKICLGAAAAIFVGAVIATLIMNRPAESSRVAIVQNGKTLYTIDLAESADREIRVEYENGGYNIVRISDGRVSVSEADCPDRTCIRTGELKAENVPIVCLPHKLVIKFTSDQENGE